MLIYMSFYVFPVNLLSCLVQPGCTQVQCSYSSFYIPFWASCGWLLCCGTSIEGHFISETNPMQSNLYQAAS